MRSVFARCCHLLGGSRPKPSSPALQGQRLLGRNAKRLGRWGMVGLALASGLTPVPVTAQETITYQYDARGRLIHVDHGATGPNANVTAAYTYDDADNRTQVVVNTGGVTLTLSPTTLPGGTVGTAYSQTITASGGTGGYTFAKTAGTLPGGLTLASGGLLSGTPTTAGTSNFTITATDSSSNTGSQPYSVTIGSGGGVCSGVNFTIASNGAVTEGTNSVFTITKHGTASGSCAVSYATANGTATAGSDYTAKSGSLTFTTAQTSKTVSVTTSDDAAVESAETFSMSLSAPTNGATIGSPGGATATLNDNDSAGVCGGVSFTIASNGAVTEGTNSVFTVTKSGTTSSSCSVNYATANGTAIAGSDYTANSNTLTFTSAQTSKTVSVVTTDDATVESAETFSMSLSNPTSGSTLGSPSSATATINDNDSTPVCSGVSFTIASNGAVTEGVNSVFTVTKTGTATGSCGVSYGTANGTATAGSDYTTKSGSLTFTTAQTSQTVSVVTTDDATVESAETFSMSLSTPTNGAILGTPSSATATINDNDSGGTCSGVSFAVNDVEVIEGDPLTFTVTRSGSTSSSCSISYATADGTASAGTNYVAKSGTLAFTSTQTSQNVTVTTIGGQIPQNRSRTMYMNISNATGGASISDSQGVGTLDSDGSICLTCLQIAPSGSTDTTSDATTPSPNSATTDPPDDASTTDPNSTDPPPEEPQ